MYSSVKSNLKKKWIWNGIFQTSFGNYFSFELYNLLNDEWGDDEKKYIIPLIKTENKGKNKSVENVKEMMVVSNFIDKQN